MMKKGGKLHYRILWQSKVMLIYLGSLGMVGYLIWYSYLRQGFSFHILFSLIYFVTFLSGFPLSLIMAYGFAHNLPSTSIQMQVFGIVGIAYIIYFFSYVYSVGGWKSVTSNRAVRQYSLSCVDKITLGLLALIGVGTLSTFVWLNDGLLLFRLEKYSQIFSPLVQGVALKRFFYFFFPALVAFFLWKPTKPNWWLLLILGVLFGGLSYLAVGGTRANLALAVVFFVLLGIYKGYLSVRWLLGLALLGIIAMFFLALARYGLDVTGKEALFTFLYLTRDSFSPWENIATIFSYDIEYQGLMPIIRDFYVYIPQTLWAERPDIVWNAANYFTKIVLGNQSGLAISPTLLGSFYIMGGYGFVAVGMVVVGIMLAMCDRLFVYAEQHSVMLQAFLWGQLFNLMILVREGMDAFVSRFVFFSIVFGLCSLIAYVIGSRRCKQ